MPDLSTSLARRVPLGFFRFQRGQGEGLSLIIIKYIPGTSPNGKFLCFACDLIFCIINTFKSSKNPMLKFPKVFHSQFYSNNKWYFAKSDLLNKLYHLYTIFDDLCLCTRIPTHIRPEIFLIIRFWLSIRIMVRRISDFGKAYLLYI